MRMGRSGFFGGLVGWRGKEVDCRGEKGALLRAAGGGGGGGGGNVKRMRDARGGRGEKLKQKRV